MWAHYANQHTGLCFEFDQEIFSDNPLIQRRQVLYSADGLVHPFRDGHLAAFEGLFSTKSLKWAYEEETRFFLFGNPRIVPVKQTGIKAIIIGHRLLNSEGLSATDAEVHRRNVRELAQVISEVNRTRPKGAKLVLKHCVKKGFGFNVETTDTGRLLSAMGAV